MYSCVFFFFNDTATTEIYTLSLHDALPIFLAAHSMAEMTSETCAIPVLSLTLMLMMFESGAIPMYLPSSSDPRSEEHTSELQSLAYLVCRLLLEKKKSSICAMYKTLCWHSP